MTFETWLLFALAMAGLALAPGPNGLLALSHGAIYGHQRALFTILGGVTGFILLMSVSILGVSAILQTHSNLLALLKLAGAVYLCWLGLKCWRAPAPQLEGEYTYHETRRRVLFRQGSFTALANPKVILVFAALIPQFIEPTRPLLPQLGIMIITFCLCEFMVEYLLARLAHRLRPWLNAKGQLFQQVCGAVFILLATIIVLEALVL